MNSFQTWFVESLDEYNIFLSLSFFPTRILKSGFASITKPLHTSVSHTLIFRKVPETVDFSRMLIEDGPFAKTPSLFEEARNSVNPAADTFIF